jgi:hypothetical protein
MMGPRARLLGIAVLAALLVGCGSVMTGGPVTTAPSSTRTTDHPALSAHSSVRPHVRATGSTSSSYVVDKTPSLPQCGLQTLHMALVDSFAGLGHSGGWLQFENVGPSACWLQGWPSVVGVTATGKETSATDYLQVLTMPPLQRPPIVVLPRYAAAVAAVLGADNSPTGAPTCPPSYQRLDVTIPGSPQVAVVSAWIAWYGTDLPSCSGIGVGPFIPPTWGPNPSFPPSPRPLNSPARQAAEAHWLRSVTS